MTIKRRFKAASQQIKSAYEAHFSKPQPPDLAPPAAATEILESMGYEAGKAFILAQRTVSVEDEIQAYMTCLDGCPADWVGKHLTAREQRTLHKSKNRVEIDQPLHRHAQTVHQR